ncbi:Flp family type IVb pilin [Dechloromonas sp. XY25]|uniref:Flp family type IVb pilin n=1 Tax=Dechloromonas hankyongensis TaxID=2908002 RepID=A0ABS9JZX7_9RHOO|nr:Flp family type IVb pilin [Dechloromonas hankyongensis]MCG2576470.1 Flp family type IVb pilin [Dechloromonas hankyongensis]
MTPTPHAAPSPIAFACHTAEAFIRDQAAVTALEYALLGSLIAAVAAAGVGTLGNHVQALWAVVANAVVAAM